MKAVNAVYPIVVEKAGDNLSMYFPDFPGTAVTADNLIEGIGRAKGMLAYRVIELEEQGQPVPAPSELEAIELCDASDRVVYVDVYLPPYRDEAANKSVTKNCTLPKWLRDAGDSAGLNYSLILQNGLKDALGIDRHV